MSSLFRALALAASACLLAHSPSVWAENPTLSLRDAIAATLQANPQLMVYELRAQALAGEQQVAGLAPPLRLAADLENLAGSGEYRRASGAEFTLALSSVIELEGQREARLAVVSARQQQLASSRRLHSLDLLTQVTQQFVALVAAQEQQLLLQQSRQLAQDTSANLRRQVQAGLSSEAELLRATANLARVDMDIQRARQQLRGEQVKLSAYWGQTAPGFTRVEADLFALPPAVPLASLLERLADNPDLAVLGDEVYLRSAELRQARAERKSAVEWSAGVRQLQASRDTALVAGVSVPLGTAGRSAPALAIASAQQAEAEQQRSSLRIQLHAELISLHGAYEQALAEVNALRNQILPPLKQAMNATAEAFNRGRYSYLELNLAQREWLDAQLALIDAAARAHRLHADIERITGAALTNTSPATLSTQVKALP